MRTTLFTTLAALTALPLCGCRSLPQGRFVPIQEYLADGDSSAKFDESGLVVRPWGARYEGDDWMRIDLVFEGPMDWIQSNGWNLQRDIVEHPNEWFEITGRDGTMCLSGPAAKNLKIQGFSDPWMYFPKYYSVQLDHGRSRVLIPIRERLCLHQSVLHETYSIRIKEGAGKDWKTKGLKFDCTPRSFEMTRNELDRSSLWQ